MCALRIISFACVNNNPARWRSYHFAKPKEFVVQEILGALEWITEGKVRNISGKLDSVYPMNQRILFVVYKLIYFYRIKILLQTLQRS